MPRSPKNTGLRIFVDRCLPPSVAVAFSRFDDIHAVHLSEVYTLPEKVQDVQFLADMGDAGWIVATQNPHMGHDTDERRAIEQHFTKVFCLTKADYPALTQGMIFGWNLRRILRRSAAPAGCFWRISEREPRKDIA